MKFIITERQYRLLNEDIKPDCSKFKWDPKKKIYDNENDYNCSLLFWEDALNLNKAYLYQKKNVISNKKIIPSIPVSEFYWQKRFGGDQWSSYSEYVKDVEPFNVKIVNYYKSLKFNFPVYVGLWTSPDIFHKFIKPNGVYFDGEAWSPVFNHPGSKPTLKLPEPIKPDPIKPEPIDPVVNPPVNDNPVIPPLAKGDKKFIFGPNDSYIGYVIKNQNGFMFYRLPKEYDEQYAVIKKDRQWLDSQSDIQLKQYLVQELGTSSIEIAK